MPTIRPPHPQTWNGDLASPPAALAPLCLMPNWVAWRWQRGKSGWTKPPFRCDDPTRHAANNDPATWSTRRAAVATVLAGKAHGVGFVLTGTDVAAIDLDKCREPETGDVDAWAQKLLDAAPGAYHEVTVSGAGLRMVKSESQVLRLAGTLTYLAWAFALGAPGSNGMAMITADLEPKEVGKEFMSAAVRAVKEYFWHHARAALRQIGLTDRHRNMRRALRWISAHEKQEVSREDIRRDALGQSLDAEQVQQLLDSLVKAGWLHADPMKTAGRTRHRWKVNPKLFALSTAESAESAESPSRPASNTT
jgi:hypothetical protein